MIIHGLCVSAKEEYFRGLHHEKDLYMLALYDEVGSLGPQTKKYTEEDEVVGRGYVAGGKALEGFTTGTINNVAYMTWTEPLIWTNSTITTVGGLIYNRSKGNRAIAVCDLGDTYTAKNGTLTISMPPKGAGALILWG